MYAVWQHNGHRLGDALNRAGVDYESLPQFALDAMVDSFQRWDAAEQRAVGA